MDRNGAWYSWLVLRLVLLLEDQSVIYLGAANGLFLSMIEHCRWISEPPWGTRWKASRFVRERHCGNGYPPGFRPERPLVLEQRRRLLPVAPDVFSRLAGPFRRAAAITCSGRVSLAR